MSSLTSDEVRVLGAIDEATLIDDLAALVAIPSVDGTEAERDAQTWCADRLRALGLDVDCWEIDLDDAVAAPDFPGMEVVRTGGLGVVGVLGDAGGATPALALYGHTDVVPPGDLDLWPERDPFTMRIDASGQAWGRGTCDMKAGVVAAIAAADALHRSGVEIAAPLAVHCVSGEEDGGFGAWATLRRGHRALACVSGEPTSGTTIPANAGSLTFRIEVTGLATHASTRSRGISAIEKFEVLHAALRFLESRRNRDAPRLFQHLDIAWPLSVGIVTAGEWASTVPDRLVAEGRYGVRIDETVDEAIADFETAIAAAADGDDWLRDHPVALSWPGGMFAPGALPDGHRFLADVASAVADVRGGAPPARGGPYGSDLRQYAAAGIPMVQYGPGDVRHAHAVDEHVALDDVVECARVYALLAVRACGPARITTI